MYTKNCLICGKEFKATKSNQKLCGSYNCKLEWQRKKHREYSKKAYDKKRMKPLVKICKVCGKEFTVNVPHQLYCSDACRFLQNTYKNRDLWLERTAKKENRQIYTKTCEHCGGTFRTLKQNRLHCSKPECRRARVEANITTYKTRERFDKKLAQETLDEYKRNHTHKKVKPTLDKMSAEDLLFYGKRRAEHYRETGQY